MSNKTIHLEENYNVLIINSDEGFYLLNLENNILRENDFELSLSKTIKGPYCEIYKPSLIRMISPNHCLFVTEKNSDTGIIAKEANDDNINPFYKSYTIMIFNIEQNKILLHFTIGHKILNVIVVDKYILISTINQILIYSQNVFINNSDPNNISFVKTIHTYSNPNGLCDAKCSKNVLVVATLGRTTGEIIICTLKKKSNLYIQAHNYNITNIILDDKCEFVATTSESGTLVNIFDLPGCSKIYQFRRGTFGTVIHDLKFDSASNYISCCSNNGTCHVFCLSDKYSETEHKNTTSNFSIFGTIVPICHSEWAFKLFKIKSGIKSKCYFLKQNNIISIIAIANDLSFYYIEDIEKNQDQVIKYDINKVIKNEIKNI